MIQGDTMKKVKRQPTEWKRILANHVSTFDKGLVSRIYKELLELHKKANNTI